MTDTEVGEPRQQRAVSRARPAGGTGLPATVLRWLAAAAILVSGYEHYDLWRGGYKLIPVIGPLFVVNIVAAVVIAGLLLWRGHVLILFLAAGFAATTLAAFILSVTVGLFNFTEALTGRAQEVSGIAEIATLLLVGAAFVLSLRGRSAAA